MEKIICFNCSSILDRYSQYTEKRIENKWVPICADCAGFKSATVKGDADNFFKRIVKSGYVRQ